MPTQPRPTKAQRREEARLAAERLRAEQARKARRQRVIIIVVAVAVVALVAVLVTMILREGGGSNGGELEAAPQGSTERGAIPVGPDGLAGSTAGAPEDAVVVSVYSDFLCPWCSLFEELNAPVLDDLREAGEVVMHYHPVSISSTGAGYSTRAAAATAFVADRAPEAYLAFHHALMVNQPTDDAGFTDAAIAQVAEGSGVPADLVQAIAAGEHATGEGSMGAWVGWATDRAAEDLSEVRTPTILLNGEMLQIDWRREGDLARAIEDARG